MSKIDAMRAMREARYAERAAGTKTPGTVRTALVRPSPAAAGTDSTAPEPSGETLCGHRSMNGRTCTREHGHAAKSHRYS